MATEFNAGSFIGRWLFALVLVMGTYNPTQWCYYSWATAQSTTFGPIVAIVGILLLIGWIDHLVAGDQPLQVGAQMAAPAAAVVRLHFHLGAEVGGDQAVLFRPQGPRGERVLGRGVTAPRAFGALALDFFDSPGLLPGQFAF